MSDKRIDGDTWQERFWDALPADRRFAHRALQKVVARIRTKRALKAGLLVKPTECQRCYHEYPLVEIHAHHRDYDNPLDVAWLCRTCHRTTHTIAGALKEYA